MGSKVDSINQHEEEVAAITKKIEVQYGKFLENPDYAHVAFATFRSIPSASVKSQIVMDRNINGLKSLAAPEPVSLLLY